MTSHQVRSDDDLIRDRDWIQFVDLLAYVARARDPCERPESYVLEKNDGHSIHGAIHSPNRTL
jgi:hypothetical protein